MSRAAAAAAAAADAAAEALRLVVVPVRIGGTASSRASANSPRDFLLYGWRGRDATSSSAAAAASSSSLPPVSAAATATDRAVLLAAHARGWVERRLEREWHSVESAPPRTLKHWLHRLANGVLSRSDPTEAALARVPRSLDAHGPAVAAAIRRAREAAAAREAGGRAAAGPPPSFAARAAATAPAAATALDQPPQQQQQPDAASFEILHPASLDARLVRRLLRRLCAKREPEHRRGALLWAAALIPQAPLSILPLPNVTIYYTLWRLYMHASAFVGARALLAALDRLSARQRAAMLMQQQQRRPLPACKGAEADGAGVAAAAAAAASTGTAASPPPPPPPPPPAAREAGGGEAGGRVAAGPSPLPAPSFVARADLPSPLSSPADADVLAALIEQPHVVERYAALVRRIEKRRQQAGGAS
jgi:hypothetical protein